MPFGLPLEIWFVNVGHGDAIIVKFPSGRATMVDINNSKSLDDATLKEVCESVGVDWFVYRLAPERIAFQKRAEIRSYEDRLEDPIEVFKRVCPGQDVFRFIATHPHLDHLSGIHRLSQQETGIDIVNFWDTPNTRTITKSEWAKMSEEDQKNWREYTRLRQSSGSPKVLNLLRGASADFYAQDQIEILSPTHAIVDEANKMDTYEGWNHLSYILRIKYGAAAVVLAGDASIDAQEELARLMGENLASTILKAPHHGRQTAYCGDFVKYVQPDYTIVSVGPKPPNDACDDYGYYTAKRVLTTRKQGTIHARLFMDGSVELYNYKGERLDLNADLRPKASAFPAYRAW